MTCTACGQKLPLGAAFCPYCGAAAPSQSQPEPAPSCEGSAPEETPEKPPCVPEAICPPADAQAAARAAQNTGETPPQSAQPEVQGGMCVREYFLCLVLFCIPVLGLIPMVAWAFSGHVCKEKRRALPCRRGAGRRAAGAYAGRGAAANRRRACAKHGVGPLCGLFAQQGLTYPCTSAILHTVHSEGELFALETASRIRWQAETPALLSGFFRPFAQHQGTRATSPPRRLRLHYSSCPPAGSLPCQRAGHGLKTANTVRAAPARNVRDTGRRPAAAR